MKPMNKGSTRRDISLNHFTIHKKRRRKRGTVDKDNFQKTRAVVPEITGSEKYFIIN